MFYPFRQTISYVKYIKENYTNMYRTITRPVVSETREAPPKRWTISMKTLTETKQWMTNCENDLVMIQWAFNGWHLSSSLLLDYLVETMSLVESSKRDYTFTQWNCTLKSKVIELGLKLLSFLLYKTQCYDIDISMVITRHYYLVTHNL